MVMFVWGASVYFAIARPPSETLDIYAVGKQWMWKFQHREGQREINTLHVPINTPVRMVITSEDVLHDLYLPTFRVKMDAIPGRYTQLWFTATKLGTYHLFCAEYCGTKHSGMVGSVTVMAQDEYQTWLSGGADGRHARAGGREALHPARVRHLPRAAATSSAGPVLNGLFGSQVTLANGEKVVADNDYIRESILNPQAKIVAGFPPHHADLPGSGERRTAARADRIHQVAAARQERSRRGRAGLLRYDAAGRHPAGRRRRSPGNRDPCLPKSRPRPRRART